mmetsp:Transcript_102695/g.295682  ORF Transcript_102695/g.295682 Transcript_102695/m.295682 type:complete len:234 (-) Transcript_102695:1007-1708(-)
MGLGRARRGFRGENVQVDAALRYGVHRATALGRTVEVVQRRFLEQGHGAVREGTSQWLPDGDDVLHGLEVLGAPLRFVDVKDKVKDLRRDHERGHLVCPDRLRQILGALVPRRRRDHKLSAAHEGRKQFPLDDSPEVGRLEQAGRRRAHLRLLAKEVDPVHQMSMVVDDALGRAGRPRGVDQQRHVVRLRANHRGRSPAPNAARARAAHGAGDGQRARPADHRPTDARAMEQE